MKEKNVYLPILDMLKIVSCLAVLFYHLGMLPGGYLAVCVFFVISGYLSYLSLSKREKFSFLDYYVRLFKRIYLPLIIVLFLTVAFFSFFPEIRWLHLKEETTSVLLGYNNFWQLNANLDYFAKNVNSPFIHLWYISILLQFDLCFPFLYLFLKKIEKKWQKKVSILFSFFLTAFFFSYFYWMSLEATRMVTYYHTFTRIFSLLLGVSWALLAEHYPSLIPKVFQEKKKSWVILSFYFLVLVGLFFLVDAQSKWMPLSMLGVSFITCRMIDYGSFLFHHTFPRKRILRYLAERSYVVYLVQYPIIFFFEYSNLESVYQFWLILLFTFLSTFLICAGLDKKREEDHFVRLKQVLFLLLIIGSSYGGYRYVIAADYRLERKKLEEQLSQNEKIVLEKQKEYELKLEQEQEEWNDLLKDMENGEEELKTIVQNLAVVGVGDSVMLGAVNNLYSQFPNGYFDAKVSRTPWVVNDILVDLKKKNLLGNPIILNLGANGDCSSSCKKEILKTCGDRDIFWVNVTNDQDVHVNAKLNSLAETYSNVHIVDWEMISKGHKEYFYADGIHLTSPGRKAYTKAIYDKIYEVYLKRYQQEQQEILKDYLEKQKDKITFYGNDILLNAFQGIEEDFKDARFHVQKNYDYQEVVEQLNHDLQENTLTNTIVFAFDETTPLGKEEYQRWIDLCKNSHVYILLTHPLDFSFSDEFVTVIPFYQELRKDEYLMMDGIHLTQDGNMALRNILKSTLSGEAK